MSNDKPWEDFSITPEESSAPWNDYDPIDEPAKDRGFTGALIDGAKSAGRAISSTYNTYTGDAQAVIDNAKTQELANEDKSQDIKNFQSDWAANTGAGTDDEVGLWGAIKGTGKAIIDNPRGAALSVVEQFPNSVPTLAAGWAGAKGGAMAGGAVGSAFGGVGAGPGALIGGAAGFVGGMFLGNTLTETGHKAQEYAADGEFTPDEQSAAMTEGAKKAGVITAVDALTFGIGGKVSSTMRRTAESAVEAATRKTLIDAGVDISDTAALAAARSNPQIASQVVEAQKNAAKIADNLRKRAGEAGALLTMETVGEGLGEYLGELAATGQASVSEAVLESFLSLGQSGVQTMFNLAKARDRSLTDQEWVDAANGIAPEGIAPEQLPVADGIWDEPAPEAKIDMGQMQDGGVTPLPVFNQQDIDRNLGPTPSQQMGINPDAGPLSAAAAQSVDSGLFVGGFTPQAGINQAALEREGVSPPPVLDAGQLERGLGERPRSTAFDDPYTPATAINPVALDRQGVTPPPVLNTDQLDRNLAPTQQAALQQPVQQPAAQRTPEQDAQNIWDNLNTFERNAAAANVLGMRGVPAKNAATKAWDKLSSEQQAKLVTGLESQQGKRWIDPNQKVTDQTGPVLQNRDRTSQDSINQMRSISNNPDYSRLKTSGFLSDGAPVVVDENIQIPASQMGVTDTASAGNERFNVQYAVVEADQLMTSNSIDGTTNAEYQTGAAGKARAIAGNGRITGLQSAWAKGNASQYKADMAADRMHGIDPAVIEGMRNPILVRLLPQDQVTDNIGDLSNRDEKGRLSPVEQAKTDMGRIDLDNLKFTADGAIGGEAIHQFRMAQPAAERVTEAEARKRLTSAIFQKAYGNDQLTEIQSGESDDAKSILSALAQAAPSMSRLEGAGEFDIRPLITQAGIAAVNAARRGTKLADYVQQSEMGIDPMVYPILEMMLNENGNIRSSKYIGEQLTNMAKLAYDEANSPSSDMFGEKPKRTAEQVIQDALTGVQGYGQINDGRGQESLGQRGRSEPDAQMVEGPEGGRERPADTRQTAPTQPEAEQEQPAAVESNAPETWRSNYIQAAKIAREKGIDPKQHKKLADLVAAIDASNTKPEAQTQLTAQQKQASGSVDGAKVHLNNSIDLTSALAAIARGAQLSTEPNGDVILSGAKIITFPKPPTSIDEVIAPLATALLEQMRADGVSMPGNPADMTRDQFAIAYHFANIIPEFEISGADIGGVVQGSSRGLTVDSDKLYDKIIEQAKEQAKPALELNQQTEESLAKDAKRLEQLQKEEAAQKVAQKAAERKQRERDADKARADEVVDDFQLGQSAEEVMSGMGDIFATESKPADKGIAAQDNDSQVTVVDDQYNPNPTEAQKQAGNYKKAHVKFQGIDITIENPVGSERSGVDPDGNTWSNTIKHDYGYIKRTTGADGDHVDVFIGKDTYSDKVFVIDQPHKNGKFDEHKVMLGFKGRAQAVAAYKGNYQKGWKVGPVTEMTVGEFKQWLSNGDTSKPVEPVAKPAAEQAKPNQAVEDYGEKMAGAIKDQPISSLSKNLTDEEMASQPLSALWPVNEPLSIEDNFAAAFSYAARQNIPAKPRLKYKVKRWVDAVKSMREIAKAVQDGEITKDNIGALSKINDTASSLAAKANLLSGLDRKHWSRIGRVDVSDNAFIFDENRNKVPSPHTVIVVDGRSVLVKGKYDNDSVTAVIKASLEMAEQSDASKRGQFEIRQNRNTGEIFINRKGDKEYRKLKTFPKGAIKEAREFVNNNTDELVAAWEAIKERDNVTKADVRSDTNKERTGIDYRNGKDVTSEEFAETFGFRGVEFGNWVSQGKGQKDRQGMLNAAYDALLDLAAVVGIPPKAVSLNGSLGIAFGSRGKGKASAHYETDNIVINLTKTKGAGSLAHEWFHALDNYFSRRRGVTPFDGNQAAYNKANYITYKPEPMMALKTSLNKKGLRPHLITKAEYDRRAKNGVNFDADSWTPDTNHPIGVRPVVEKAFAELVSELDKSPMLKRSETIDKGKVDGYWSSIIERAARSFESYVIQRLEDQGITNEYLANVVPVEQFMRDPGRYPYLTSEELKPVAEKFDTLFSTIETREEKRGNFLMFSRHNNQPNNPTTNASLLKNINDSYPALTDSVVTMLQRGRKGQKGGLVIVDSNNGADIAKAYSEATGMPIAQANRLFSDGESINGFYDTKSGITFLVGPNLDAKTAPAVLLHEVTHSQQRSEIDARSMKLINGRAKEKNADLKAFLETVSQRMIDAGEYGNPLESTTYIVEQAIIEGRSQGYTLADSKFLNAIEKTLGSTVASIVRDFTKMVRQFALRRGLPINITLDDLVQYAMASVEQAAKGNIATENKGGMAYSFAGEDALTADLASLAEAKKQIATDLTPDQVRKNTGWMQGAEGRWRFEIDDSKASFVDAPMLDSYLAGTLTGEKKLNAADQKALNLLKLKERKMSAEVFGAKDKETEAWDQLFYEWHQVKQQIQTLERRASGEFMNVGSLLKHDQLLNAYPGMKNIKIRLAVDDSVTMNGFYDRKDNLIEMTAPNKEKLMDGLLHELQHAIQSIEGFARGGSPSQFDYKDATSEYLGRVSNKIIDLLNSNKEFGATVRKVKQEFTKLSNKYPLVTKDGQESVNWDKVPTDESEAYFKLLDETEKHPEVERWHDLETEYRIVRRDGKTLTPFEQYQSLAGEVEARNVESRRYFTEEERKEFSPIASEDFQRQDQTIRYSRNAKAKAGVQHSAGQQLPASTFTEVLEALSDMGVEHRISERSDIITVSKIVVPGDKRGEGKGSAAMRVLTNYADATGKHIALTPTADFGGNKTRLKEFYQRFGFKENKGKNKVYEVSESMVRENSDGRTLYSKAGATTNTPAFKRWFGDSKVVDANGEPMVVYHGTDKDIEAFDRDFINYRFPYSFGFHFSSRAAEAGSYTREGVGERGSRTMDGGNIMPVYIKAENPLIIETSELSPSMEADLNRGKIIEQLVMAKRAGKPYDSVIIKRKNQDESSGDPEHWNVIVFDPTQIKSAIGNNGDFDGTNPDIRYSRSQTKTAALKKQFGDSKVVDANGDPLLVYHGSGAKFATFDKNKRGATTRAKSAEEGFFFTSSKSLAYDFKKQAEGAAADLDAIRSAVEGLSDSQLESLASDIGRIASEDLDLEGREFFIDSLMDMYQYDTDINTWPEESNGTPKVLKKYIPKDILEPGAVHDVYLRIENPYEHIFSVDDDWHDEGAITRAISIAKKNGNDGVILRNMVDVARADEKGNNAIRSDVYIAFEPDQIIQSEDSAGIRFSRSANPASISAAPNGMAAWDSPSASKFDDFVYKMQDKHVDTKRVIEAIRDTGKAISDDLDVYLQETLFHGRAAKRTQDFLNKEVTPLIEYMQSAKVEMSDLEEFLHARHAQEANALIAKRDPNMPDGGSGMTNAEAAKYLKSLNGVRRKQLENAAKFVDKIIGGTRETIVSYGLESQETVDGWTAGFKHYIPLQREDKDGQMGIGQGFSVKGKETKGRTGSTRKVVDILANVMMQRERAIVRGEKNRVAVALLGLAKDNPLPEFWQVNKVPTTRVLDKATGLVRNQVDPMYKSRDNAIVAKVNGKEHAILMNEDDPRAMRMAEALKNLDAAQLEGLLGATATATRYFAAVNTQYNPIFGVTNFVRDIQEAMLHLQSTPLAGQQARLFKNTFTAVGAVMKAERDGRKGNNATGKWGVLWEDFQNTGGQTGFRDQFSNSADRGKEIQRALTPDGWAETGLGKFFTANGALKAPLEVVRKKAAWLFDLLSDYNTAMENGVRLSAYETGINAGMSKEQAAALAKGLTVNFNRKGQVTQQVGALYAFFNASVQGTARLGQSLFDMDAGKPKTLRLSSLGKKIVSGGVMLGASQAVLLAMAGFDDEEPPEFIRERNIIIPTGGKTYISIPMPLGYHVIANLGRIPMEFVLGGGKDGAKYLFNLMDVMADIYNPIGNSGLSMQTIAPTVLDPLAGLAENKDFSGRAIAKESFNRQTPGHALARDTASLPATWLAELVNYATGGTEFTRGELSPTPDQIDYLVGQLTGGVGRETTKFMKSIQATATGDDLPWHNIPLAGRFFGDADSDGAKQSAFYNNMDKVRKHAEEVKGLRAAGRISEAIEYANKHPQAKLHLAARAAEKQVKDMRDRKRDLEQAGAPREEIRALEKRMVQRMEQFVELAKAQ